MNRSALRAGMVLLFLLGGWLAGCDLAPATPPVAPAATATFVAITPTPAPQGGAPSATPLAAAAGGVTPLPAATPPVARATPSAVAPPATLATPPPVTPA